MEIIQIPQEQAFVQLQSWEILPIWRALARARENMTRDEYINAFEVRPKYGVKLERKFSDALEVARNNRPDLMNR